MRTNCGAILAAVCLVTCGSERFVEVGHAPQESFDEQCQSDLDCPSGDVCLNQECIPVESLDCSATILPQINLSSMHVDFSDVQIGNVATQSLVISNTGECALTLFGVGMSDESSPDFSCAPCDINRYPHLIAPHRSAEITVRYNPRGVGEALGTLLIRSDDTSVGQDGMLSVAIRGVYGGVPALVIEPQEVNFGFVTFDAAASNARTENVRITNQGTGNAVLQVQFIYVQQGSDFSLAPELAAISPANPVLLPPYDAENPTTWIDVPVTFQPSRFANHESALTVHASDGSDIAAVASTRLVASSLGSPMISVTPQELTFVEDDGSPLSLGRVAFEQFSITNLGEAELTASLSLDDPSGEFSFSPSHLAPLPPGGSASVGVYYTPTRGSDPFNLRDPQAPVTSYLRIESNDAQNILTTVTLKGFARQGVSDDILKVEMTFENDDSSWAGNDFRNVDLELESPMGMACRKPVYDYTRSPDGTYVISGTRDYCAQWSATQLEGTVNWLPGGVYEEPERVVLFGLGSDLGTEGRFVVRLHYAEDCSNLPTGVLGQVLGLGTSALLGLLGGAAGIPISVDPGSISNLITQNCWGHSATVATVKVVVSGREIAAPRVNLRSKGDYKEVVSLRRRLGSFEVVEGE